MKNVTLKCFENFKCIADKCSDNCCIGWEIDVDAETLRFYESLAEPEKSCIMSRISKDGTPHFKMDEANRCPFLNKNNLCDIIIKYGEDNIPYICKHHPRFYTWLTDRVESGIGLCCEVAASKVLSSHKKLDTRIQYTLSDTPEDTMTYARDVAFSILQNRDLPLGTRLGIFSEFCDELDDYLIFEDTKAIKRIADTYKTRKSCTFDEGLEIDSLLALFSDLVPIDKSWTRLIGCIKSRKDEILDYLRRFAQENHDNLYKYEHLAVYFTYRHFLASLEDFCIAQTGDFIVISVVACALFDAYSLIEFKDAQTEKNARIYSKQVEYSAENTALVRDSGQQNIKAILPVIFGE